MEPTLKLASLCVHDPEAPLHNRVHQLPIYPASSFAFDSIEQGIDIFDGRAPGHMYSRFGNPTVDAVAAKLAALEGHGLDVSPMGLLTSSGMAAIATLALGLLKSGDKILTQADLYGGSTDLFKRILAPLGILPVVANLRDLTEVERLLAADPAIRLLYTETPSNPVLRCVDLAALAELARRYDRWTAVDNTFCTPIIQQPFAFGIDFVVHSTTKYLNGHGNGIAGVVIGRDADLARERLLPALKLVGTNSNPWDAWMLHNGLKTLALRMERHSENGRRVAEFLAAHPKVERVNALALTEHPDYALSQRQMRLPGGMISFELQGGLEAGKAFMNRLRFCTLAPTLGDVDTLVLHPATMSHRTIPPEVRAAHGIADGLIRISVGIESVEDIISDLESALK